MISRYRVGNMVNFEGSGPHQITEIDQTDLLYRYEGDSRWYGHSDLTDIPLTMAWVQRLGFQPKTVSYNNFRGEPIEWTGFCNPTLGDYFCFRIHSEGSVLMFVKVGQHLQGTLWEFWYKGEPAVSSVHELQNYFELYHEVTLPFMF